MLWRLAKDCSADLPDLEVQALALWLRGVPHNRAAALLGVTPGCASQLRARLQERALMHSEGNPPAPPAGKGARAGPSVRPGTARA